MSWTRTTRTWHLWIGLIMSAFLLIDAGTGLILSEPWIIGYKKGKPAAAAPAPAAAVDKAPAGTAGGELRPPAPAAGPTDKAAKLYRFFKGLHQGRVGSVNLKWLADLIAVAVILLTLTGIWMAVIRLWARSRGRGAC